MKLSRNQLRQLILEAVKQKEVKESDIRKAVVQCLEKEGGAAGIDLIIKHVKKLQTKTKKLPQNLRTNKALVRHILKMDDIVKHRKGDIILMKGLPKRKK